MFITENVGMTKAELDRIADEVQAAVEVFGAKWIGSVYGTYEKGCAPRVSVWISLTTPLPAPTPEEEELPPGVDVSPLGFRPWEMRLATRVAGAVAKVVYPIIERTGVGVHVVVDGLERRPIPLPPEEVGTG
jgi:hypothetical protein